ncbi:MAG: terminase [Mesorhizobium sp.]|uniref:terminase n=1 Tax=Mesorhizobium sp. TaxID=1871066 RepID=UPI0012293EA9|nr:terminase [Mesorhizobium sp.]TIO15618.1 MAG: terminase [Mesorhizobium sp.]
MASASTAKINPDQFLDPRWRLSNLYTITDKSGNAIPFRPNDSQLEFLDDIHALNIILKARQLGFTTLCCLIYLDACIFTPNTRAGVIAHKLDDSKVIFRDKIKFPYDNLDEGLKNLVATKQDSADTLTLANNSSIRVSTSMRSGTLQYLHISEFGKICSQYPEKAREIVTGALNTVEAGQFVAIESTAEGQDGKFYEMVQNARAKEAAGTELSNLDYKFHFYPWWKDKGYVITRGLPVINVEDREYFEKLKAQGIQTTPEQRAWYVKKAEIQAGDMRREFPSTPDEAFEQALEGAYFSKELLVAAKQKRIGGFPFVPGAVVNSFWDLGRNDNNTLWLHQFVDGFHRFVGYYENSGEYISHYISWLREWGRDRNAIFGDHYLPHDGDRQSIWLPEGTMKVMSDLKFRPIIVKRPENKVEAINIARGKFASCQFDEAGCSIGLKRLKAYRKEWDDQRGVWKDRPLHDDASHTADGFMTFTSSNYTPPMQAKPRERYGSKSSSSTSWMAG